MLPPFLLIHGAWHGKWCWEPLQRALADKGARSLAIDLPGHGDRRKNAWSVGWQHYVSAVIDAAGSMEKPPILVGHSMGGGVITSAADVRPELFAGLLYLAAFVPRDNDSIMSLASRGAKPSGLRVRPWRCDSVFAQEDAQRHFFHDCTDGEQWASLVQPQPMRPVLTRLRLRSPDAHGLPRTFIAAREDRAIPLALQHKMATNAGIDRVHEVNTGHSPFLVQPDRLADMLLSSMGTELRFETDQAAR